MPSSTHNANGVSGRVHPGEQRPCALALVEFHGYNRDIGMPWLLERAGCGELQSRPQALDQTFSAIRKGPKELPR